MADGMIYIPMRYRVDLDRTINTTPLNTLFAMGDNQAHRFELTITHGSVAEDLTGCEVKGKFVSFSNNMTVILTGSVENGNAVVTLKQPCYTQLGRFALVIQIVKDGMKTSVFYGDGYMRNTSTDNAIIDEDYIVYDTDVLLSKIQEIDTAISGANAAIANANAAAENVDANMDAKITARVDKTLSVENGIADAKTVGNEIGSLKDEIDIYNPVDITWISGSYYDNYGTLTYHNSFSRTDFLKIYPGQKVVIKAETWNDYIAAVCFFDANKTFVSSLYKVAEPSGKEYSFICPDGVSYFTVSKHNSNYVAMVKYGQKTTAIKDLEIKNEELDAKITDLNNEINSKERDLNKKIDDKLNKVIGKNLFNGKYTTGFLDSSGNFASVDVGYVVTDFIKVEENVEYIATNSYCSSAAHVFYDENKEIINTVEATVEPLQLVTPPSCAYVRLTIAKEKIDNFMFMKGSVLEPYEPYTEFEPLEQAKKRIDSLESIKAVASPFSLKQDVLNNGEAMTVEVPNSKKDDSITFYANITSFDTLLISYGGEDNWLGGNILIEPTTIKVYRANINEAGSGTEHALSFDDFIKIYIKRGGNMKTATLTIQTRTTTFSQNINWTACGSTIKVLSTNSSLTNCELYYVRDDLKAETWMFGDSYFDYYPIVLADKGYSKQFMADGHTGRASMAALKSLKLCLERAIPKRIIWAMGMNDQDTTDKVNATWYNCYEELTSICSAMNIELILVTIPLVPSSATRNKYKNEIIRNSGYRYVDFSKAVGSERDDSHTWYEGIMHSDGIHPNNELGSKFFAEYLLITVPELMAEI